MTEEIGKSERKKRGSRAVPREELEREFPSLTHLTGPPTKAAKKAWVAVFNARPDAMHGLLADFIKAVHAQPGRIGQRPMPKEEQVDLEALLYGEENNQPIYEVLPKLVTMSQVQFCQRIHFSRAQYQRLLNGDYDPDVNELRKIAEVLGKPPTYFVEYRKAMAVAAFLNLIEERPNIATSLYKQYLEVRF